MTRKRGTDLAAREVVGERLPHALKAGRDGALDRRPTGPRHAGLSTTSLLLAIRAGRSAAKMVGGHTMAAHHQNRADHSGGSSFMASSMFTPLTRRRYVREMP